MLSVTAFISESIHIKTPRIITRTVDFGIPAIKYFSTKTFGIQYAL